MAMTIHCDIVSAEEEIYSGRAKLIVANGVQGDLGVTYGHAPLLTSLEPGPVRVVLDSGEELIYYVSGGFLEVQPNVVSILADTALRADDLDEAAALEAQKQAQADMLNQSGDIDYGRAAANLAAASAQLRTLQQIRKTINKTK
ncbi:F0F1 ATP synthase subunit epsilon [Spongiibacter taiwanensis]|uniref:F0F1 ATP synthase subunit epsilon n=1 Tax=Spongiibacter taiwanensis TaxID=1748242 RepID=UPI002035BFEF|nr:F0F1 ATP synthase subunit epsilon [Spongiibacter taiwanensis]USA41820.1 F0F1 ATP synthase subunit epsilon [Spongiibacter taiwanensis]